MRCSHKSLAEFGIEGGGQCGRKSKSIFTAPRYAKRRSTITMRSLTRLSHAIRLLRKNVCVCISIGSFASSAKLGELHSKRHHGLVIKGFPVRPLPPVAKAGVIEYRLEDRFQPITQRLLTHPVLNCGDDGFQSTPLS